MSKTWRCDCQSVGRVDTQIKKKMNMAITFYKDGPSNLQPISSFISAAAALSRVTAWWWQWEVSVVGGVSGGGSWTFRFLMNVPLLQCSNIRLLRQVLLQTLHQALKKQLCCNYARQPAAGKTWRVRQDWTERRCRLFHVVRQRDVTAAGGGSFTAWMWKCRLFSFTSCKVDRLIRGVLESVHIQSDGFPWSFHDSVCRSGCRLNM